MLAAVVEWDPKVSAGELLTTVGLLLALVGAWRAATQFEASQRATRAQFLLNWAPLLAGHETTHARLQEDHNWVPSRSDERAIERYMGLLETLWVLIESDVIDAAVAERLYGYRLRDIIDNDHVRSKMLAEQGKGWDDFLRLWACLDRHRVSTGQDVLVPGKTAPISI